MIVGLIVFLGATSIFDRAQAYLLDNFKQSKLQQLNGMSALVDSEIHNRFDNLQSSKQSYYNRLQNAFADLQKKNDEVSRIYSLNFRDQKLRVAVDSARADEEAILIMSERFGALISKINTKEFRLTQLQQFSPATHQDNGLAAEITLKREKDSTLLRFGQTEILRLAHSKSLSASAKDVKLDKSTSRLYKAELEIPARATFYYRYVHKGQPLSPPGGDYWVAESVKRQLVTVIGKGDSLIVAADPSNAISDLMMVSPLVDSQGDARGALVMEIPARSLESMSDNFLQSVLLIFSLVAVSILVAAIFFARKITRPLEQLNLAIARLIKNDFNFKLSSKGFGSFRFLAQQFNQMLAHIQKSRNQLISLNKSYSRFVPHQLLKQLSHIGVSDISLGDCCEREMTVLFCDIRGFTTMSESMTPQANFNFINRYLSQIAPVINKRGGIIDKYLGDGIMALFPNGADQALKAAIEMLDALAKYNETLKQKGLPIIEVGLGLHSGRMMLGTVGTPLRMDATVVSDTVNAAARVESMTKAFCTKILITEETKRQLQTLDFYQIRYIASCRIQGKSKPVTLYEVFNNDSLSLQKEKAANQSMMIRAWKRYRQGDSAAAIALYQRLIEKSPEDKSLFALIERCQSGRL